MAAQPVPGFTHEQGSRMSLAGDDLEHVIVVPGRHFAPTASAGSATAISGDEVEGDFAQEGEVVGGSAIIRDCLDQRTSGMIFSQRTIRLMH